MKRADLISHRRSLIVVFQAVLLKFGAGELLSTVWYGGFKRRARVMRVLEPCYEQCSASMLDGRISILASTLARHTALSEPLGLAESTLE